MNISALLMTLCSLCFSTPATAGDINRSQECFASTSQAWKVYPGQHLYRHKTPNGMCWHIGKKNHSGTFVASPSQPKKESHSVSYNSHRSTPSASGTSKWRVPQQWNVYPEFQRWPKFYDIERTKEFQQYGGPPVRYSDPWK